MSAYEEKSLAQEEKRVFLKKLGKIMPKALSLSNLQPAHNPNQNTY